MCIPRRFSQRFMVARIADRLRRRGFQRLKCLISDPLDESKWREETIPSRLYFRGSQCESIPSLSCFRVLVVFLRAAESRTSGSRWIDYLVCSARFCRVGISPAQNRATFSLVFPHCSHFGRRSAYARLSANLRDTRRINGILISRSIDILY